MSAPITVVGGDDGTTARFEDMLGVADMLERAAADVADTVDFVGFQHVCWELIWGASLELLDNLRVRELLAELDSPFSEANLVVVRLRADSARLRFAVAAYQHTDDGICGGGIFGTLCTAVGALPVALGAGAGSLLRGDGLGHAAQVALTDDPALVDAFIDFTPLGKLETQLGGYYPDGHAVVSDLGIDRRQVPPPRELADLVEGVAVRSEGAAGEISVAFVTGADGVRRVIVDIPGTKSWNPGPTSNVTSLSTNARALVGAPTSYEHGVLTAMARAGVRPQDEVMLVGHSEGGMVAVETARDAVRSGRFQVTHVVTAGAPIGLTAGSVPGTVRVLALENETDIVPHFDGRANPDRRNVITVTVRHGDGTVSDDHDLRDSYEPGARDAGVSDNASVRDFVRSADGFLGGTDIRTHAYLVSRA